MRLKRAQIQFCQRQDLIGDNTEIMKNRRPRERSSSLSAIFQSDKHPDQSLVISGYFLVAKSRSSLSLARARIRSFVKALRYVAPRVALQNKERGKKKKRTVLESTLASDDYLSRGTVGRFFMRCSVYALIQLDERKKNCANSASLDIGSRYFFLLSLFIVLSSTPLTHASCNAFAQVGTTRKLVIKPSFNLSLVIRNCQRRESRKVRWEIIMQIRANTTKPRGTDLTVINKCWWRIYQIYGNRQSKRINSTDWKMGKSWRPLIHRIGTKFNYGGLSWLYCAFLHIICIVLLNTLFF